MTTTTYPPYAGFYKFNFLAQEMLHQTNMQIQTINDLETSNILNNLITKSSLVSIFGKNFKIYGLLKQQNDFYWVEQNNCFAEFNNSDVEKIDIRTKEITIYLK